MNKKLVALAVAGALSAPLAVQAQTANVTLYGRANMDLEFVKGQQRRRLEPDRQSREQQLVAFRMRGTESLGGGLNAIFQLESNVSCDTGNAASSSLASRETFVGLQGSWGKVTMGKFLMPQDDIRFIFDNSITLANVDPVRRRDLGAGATEQGYRRLRRAYRQQRPLRLAELERLHRARCNTRRATRRATRKTSSAARPRSPPRRRWRA